MRNSGQGFDGFDIGPTHEGSEVKVNENEDGDMSGASGCRFGRDCLVPYIAFQAPTCAASCWSGQTES